MEIHATGFMAWAGLILIIIGAFSVLKCFIMGIAENMFD